MAGRHLSKRLLANLLVAKHSKQSYVAACISTTASCQEGKNWISKLLVRQIEPTKDPHSRLLSDLDDVYELQVHCVKPENMEEYLKQYQHFVDVMRLKKTGADLAGSWTVMIGDQDEAIHLWRYKGGYPVLNKATNIYRTDEVSSLELDEEILQYRLQRNKMLRSRNNQILLRFSFWPLVEKRDGPNLYELRSYVLKPGTMIEWGNNWNRGINLRQVNDEACGGFFSHIGELYNVHHLWAYEDLQSRKEIRESAWRKPGWDDIVAYTVPLMRHMKSRILVPTPFSPLQ